MHNEQLRPDMRRLWQSQIVESMPMSLDALRRGASKTNRLIRARTWAAGLGFLIFIGLFGALLSVTAAAPLVRRIDIEIMECVFLVGAGYSFWQLIALLRRARGESLIEGEPNACAAFYRAELERQRNFYRHSMIWVPLAFSALWGWAALAIPFFRPTMVVIWLLFVLAWVYHSVAAARNAQRELDSVNGSSG
jgi:hypothetical protein